VILETSLGHAARIDGAHRQETFVMMLNCNKFSQMGRHRYASGGQNGARFFFANIDNWFLAMNERSHWKLFMNEMARENKTLSDIQ
jgi:hypothetical protein